MMLGYHTSEGYTHFELVFIITIFNWQVMACIHALTNCLRAYKMCKRCKVNSAVSGTNKCNV